MPALSFSAVEILPALLSHEKTQTVRPAFCEGCEMPFDFALKDGEDLTRFSKELSKHKELHEHKPRFKVGDKVIVYWKQRTSPKDAWFCKECGQIALPLKKEQLPCEHLQRNKLKVQPNEEFSRAILKWKVPEESLFPKQLGMVEITEVFTVEMFHSLEGDSTFVTFVGGEERPTMTIEKMKELAKKDGFKSDVEMIDWFSSHYNLSSPKKFHVYRFKWL